VSFAPAHREFLQGLARIIADDIQNEQAKLENGNSLKVKGLPEKKKSAHPILTLSRRKGFRIDG